ncbi:protein [Scardovia inopinata]|uniref:Uncharacterized protein n=1 Tax=Scardovia inopinata F0304 TaxID=641146 RepID=W5IH26_SCAIO|nr:hypothetical protein [Scardovia inopinata]EFG26294.1 hypothetical protein HMPREF9020_01378 [Scardovia inopinata F0304]BAR07073.1 conserved hypothetical protein [Scardovia inopinata JCM 12537]SUV51142.1 protein [Scardovia inopinata]
MTFTLTPDSPISPALFIFALVILILLAAVGLVLLIMGSKQQGTQEKNRRQVKKKTRADWKNRITAVTKDYSRGLLTDKQAYHRLAVLARQFASEKMGKDVTNQTLTEIKRSADRNPGLTTPSDASASEGYIALRQTIEALYPPEFADSRYNPAAQKSTVKDAASWVIGLIERWD